ncbi:MAG: hypothetical protein WCJ01_05040 [Ignavibacteria bacterium]
MEITGYHGTDENSVNKISRNGFIPSDNNNWLGQGIYFFGNIKELNISGKSEAVDWAVKVRKFRSFGIFEALIISNNYIDIARDEEHKQLYEDIRRAALAKHGQLGKLQKDFKESLVFTKLEKIGTADFIIALTDGAKNPPFLNYVVRRPQLQICIKNNNCIIKNYLIDCGESK